MAERGVNEVVNEERPIVGVPYGAQHSGMRQIRPRCTLSLTPRPVAQLPGRRSSLSRRCRSRPSVEHRSHRETNPIFLRMSGNAGKVGASCSHSAQRALGKPHLQPCECVLHDQTMRRLPTASPGPRHKEPKSSDRVLWLATKARKMRHPAHLTR